MPYYPSMQASQLFSFRQALKTSTSGRSSDQNSSRRKNVLSKTKTTPRANVDNIREQAKKDSKSGVRGGNLFNAKYVPFASSDKSETYSLDEVIYRSKNGGLLDVEHDMEALGKYPAGTRKEEICHERDSSLVRRRRALYSIAFRRRDWLFFFGFFNPFSSYPKI
jgi:hypothetical protein